MSKAVGIIPARLASTRFPEKVLADRTGRTLVQHVYEAASGASSLSRVVIAADDERIVRAVRAFGGEVVLTSVDHPNGTSRLREAAAMLGLADDQLVVNIQGDEPELEAVAIDSAVSALLAAERLGVTVGTVAAPLQASEADNPNIVKVVRALDGRALYFSRSRIPFVRDAGDTAVFLRHVGIYTYRVGFLNRYATMAPTPLERAEQLEQLRVLESGHGIAVGLIERAHPGIDTPEQYDAFVTRWLARHASGQPETKARPPSGR